MVDLRGGGGGGGGPPLNPGAILQISNVSKGTLTSQ